MENFLTPVLALIIWTFVMWAVMYKRRIPAMQAISKDPQAFIENPSLGEQMPKSAIWAADNYNHLHEQPVIFYALMFYLYLTKLTPEWMLYLAWAYVAIRVLHSLVQITGNKVMVRFSIFVIGSIILMIMALYAAGFLVGGMLA